MARPKKTELSPQVGTVTAGRKRGNPDFVSSSFYVPKAVNIGFDRALLTLKANGFEVDRSDILSVLMDRFSEAVAAAEQQGDGLDLDAILSAALEGSVVDTAGLTYLKLQLQKQLEQARVLVAEYEVLQQQKDAVHQQVVSVLLAAIPDADLRQKLAAELTDGESSAQQARESLAVKERDQMLLAAFDPAVENLEKLPDRESSAQQA
jgi:hypothetical protein